MAYFDRFDICEAYACLEADYNVDGFVPERDDDRLHRASVDKTLRAESIGWQLHRMRFRARPFLCTATLTDNAREIYDAAVMRLGLPVPEDIEP